MPSPEPPASAAFATRLAAVLTERARPIKLDAGLPARDTQPWDLVIWLRTSPGAGPTSDGDSDRRERREREARADIVIDLHDQDWPVIRRVATRLAAGGAWYLTETRAFFAYRAATWDTKFGNDLPAYTAAITEAALPRGGVVLDIGCGSGRALAEGVLRRATSASGWKVTAYEDATHRFFAVAERC